jgi:HEAT repeat protein
MNFSLPPIHGFSFWLGFLLASLLWWVLSMLRPAFKQMQAASRAKQAEKREKAHAVSAIEERYRQMVLQQVQGLHVAAPLFSLDEVLEPPLLLAPPPRVEPGLPLYNEDIVDSTIPYLPAWPDLAAAYKGHTLTLGEALSGNADVVLTGQTGMGKTVAMACLASRLARRDPEPGLPQHTLPFYIHAADLNLPVNKDAPLSSLIELIADKAAVFDAGRIPDLVRHAFQEKRALLLLDGTDELAPEALKDVIDFIRAVKKTYPKARMVTTASTEYLDGLVSLNFIPFAMAAWTSDARARFLSRWGDLWNRYVAVEAWAQIAEQIDPLVLNGWLNADSSYSTPLELTLRAWGAYAGDIRGPRPQDGLETHIRRMTPANAPRQALEMLALQVNLATEAFFDPRKARDWIRSFEPDEASPSDGAEDTKSRKSRKAQAPSMGLIAKMADSGLLTQHRGNRMRFAHPAFGGYLTGRALANYKAESILSQPPWIGKHLAMYYLAANGEASPLATVLLDQIDRPLSRNLLIMGRWLREAPHRAAWRGPVMAKLAELLQQRGQPLGLRGQALVAIIASGDPGTTLLLRQMLGSNDGELLQLAALGCGVLRDVKSLPLLSGLLNNPSPGVRRGACLALVGIGTAPAMDAVASALLHGDENLRRAAAEALANSPVEGHGMLKEGAALQDDLMVRRAATYGLGRIHEPWADELLNKLQVEDDQWAVRDAAAEVMQSALQANLRIPKRLPPPSESPWIIAFAGKQGMGVSPDKQPTDLLLLALKSGTDDERLASLSYLRMMPMEGVFGGLYQAMYGGDPSLREAAFQTASEMAARGVEVPDPVQFGVGL